MHVCLGIHEGMAIFVFIVCFNLYSVSLCKTVEMYIAFYAEVWIFLNG